MSNIIDKGLTNKQKELIANQIIKSLNKHNTHTKKQLGECVYCLDCNERLYQGEL